MVSDELGLDKPGALARYFSERWLEEPSDKGEQLIAWLLEAALGRNTLYFIEKTKEYIDAWPRPDPPSRRRIWPVLPWKNNPSHANQPRWRGNREIVPVDAFDGFAITGDPIEDTIIPHAVLVWTCMNDRPWPEEVYHRWLDSLLAAGSAEAAYLAASLWPAHDLMAKVTYRPAALLVDRGQLDAEAERVILTEMLRGIDELRPSLYGRCSSEYDDFQNPERLPSWYIYDHGFTHRICGLIEPSAFLLWNDYLRLLIREALTAPNWSEGVKDAAMLLYISLNEFKNSLKEPKISDSAVQAYGEIEESDKLRRFSTNTQEFIEILEKNLFKLDEKHINIINFHIGKIENIDYNLIKDYINHFIILYNNSVYEGSIHRALNINLEKILRKYTSIGLKTNEILYIGPKLKNIILDLEKEGLKNKNVDEIKEDIRGKIKYLDEIKSLVDQFRVSKYLTDDEILYSIVDILKREEKIIFSSQFIKDYKKIAEAWHPRRRWILGDKMLLDSNHIGLYFYYDVLQKWPPEHLIPDLYSRRTRRHLYDENMLDALFKRPGRLVDFRLYINEEKELKIFSGTRKRIVENLHGNKANKKEKNIGLSLGL